MDELILSIDPVDELIFKGSFDKEVESVISLQNNINSKVTYKVRCTRQMVSCYSAVPNYGIIHGGEKAVVKIKMYPRDRYERSYNVNNHEFVLCYMVLPTMSYRTLEEIWKDTSRYRNMTTIFEKVLKVKMITSKPTTSPSNNDAVVSTMQCPICIDIAKDAVETSCCHQIFCKRCTIPLSSCAMCRKPFTTTPSYVIRRMIGALPEKCSYCLKSVPRSDMEDHKSKSCENRPFKCWVSSCTCITTFIGKKEFIAHFVQQHEDHILNRDISFFDPIATQRRGNQQIRLAANGKYYCGGNLHELHHISYNGYNNICCDGLCGPDEGCNCRECMILDIKSRRLPQGCYVNMVGATSRRGKSGHFYCGREVLEQNDICDGWCGPDDGPSCGMCQVLEHQMDFEYAGISESVW